MSILPDPAWPGPTLPDEEVDRDMKGAQLIDWETKEWKLESIEHNLLEVERELISKVPIRSSQERDKVIWPWNTCGSFAVKSACQVALKKLEQKVDVAKA